MKKAFILLSLLPTMLLAQANEGGEDQGSSDYPYQVGNETYKLSIDNKGYASVSSQIGGVYIANNTLEPMTQQLIVGVYPEEGGESIDYFELGEVTVNPHDAKGVSYGYQDLHSQTMPDAPQTLVPGQNYQLRLEDPTTGEFLTETLVLYFRENITIEYTVPETGWGTLCLPFGPNYQPEDLTAYFTIGINDDELSLMEVPFLGIGREPVVVKGTPGATYSFTGPDAPKGLQSFLFLTSSTEGDIYAPKGSYVLQCHDGITGFYKVQEDNQELVNQYEAYLAPSTECGDFLSLSVDRWPTAIESVCAHPQVSDDQTFNIFGSKVGEGYRGIVIKYGKKVMQNR